MGLFDIVEGLYDHPTPCDHRPWRYVPKSDRVALATAKRKAKEAEAHRFDGMRDAYRDAYVRMVSR